MATIKLVQFNGHDIPAPTQYDVGLNAIDSANSGRNDAGIMTREVVRKNVANIDIGWTMLDDSELETIMNEIQNDEVTVKYYKGGYETAKMYVGQISLSLKTLDSGAYWDLSFPLVEY